MKGVAQLRGLAVGAGALVLVACGGGGSGGSGSAGTLASNAKSAQAPAAWTDYNPSATYTSVVSKQGYQITMSDGVVLAATVIFPADSSGNAVTTPMPVILSQDAYNKAVPGANGEDDYIIEHGYIQVIVDVRGTGNSGGQWEAFSAREQQDSNEILNWLAQQSWCNQSVGTYGASYLGINQLFTAQWQNPIHKAEFAIVPMADAYRDVVFTGGEINTGFIPLWMGLVAGLGEVPTDPTNPPGEAQALVTHLGSTLTNFQVPLILQALAGDPNTVYDGPFWQQRSPIEVVPKIKIPTFIVGGLHDLFQRGEPLLYNALKNQTNTKLLIGPWAHVEAALGLGLPADGVPALDHIALQWFDHYLKNVNNGADTQPAVTQYYYGENHYVTATDWPNPNLSAQRWYLHNGGTLDNAAATGSENPTLLPQQPVDGLCSLSLEQWTAGILNGGALGAGDPSNPAVFDALSQLQPPCVTNNAMDEALYEKSFTTAPMAQDYAINGPIEADVWMSTSATNGTVAVTLTDVAPDGTSTPMTNGIQMMSFSAVDDSNPTTYTLNDASGSPQRLRPWHPFTQASLVTVTPGQPMLVPVEVFPSSFVIKQGHRLRVDIGPSDIVQGMPPVPSLLQGLVGLMQIYSDAQHPSSVVVPTLPITALEAGLSP